jgi:hippurate hydrolase
MEKIASMLLRSTVICLLAFLPVHRVLSAAEHPAGEEAMRAWVKAETPALVPLYQHFHAHPELSLEERETAARLAEELRAVGAEVTSGVGGHGVVAVLQHNAGPTVLVRTDLDALPVSETTGLPYASQVKVRTDDGVDVGVMHACGHDIHMTCLVGTARFLAAHKERWRGTVVLIGQPAEERVAGAKAMLAGGLYERFPKPDYALALHVDAALAAGRVGCRPGYCLANTDSVDITVRGKGGHGAYPYTTVDPIVEATQLVLALQTIVSREVKATEPVVITVGSIHGGTKSNIIPDNCRLQLTVRTYSPTVREQVFQSIQRKAKAIAAACGAPDPVIDIHPGSPAVRNDDELAAAAIRVFGRVLGPGNVEPAELSMGGEDFSLFGRDGVPIVMFRLGSVDAHRLAQFEGLGQAPPSLHSAAYYPDAELTLQTGVMAMSSLVLDLLQHEGSEGAKTRP